MLHHRRRTAAMTAVAALGAVALTACGSGDPGGTAPQDVEITVGYAGGGAMDTYMETLLDRVREEIPGLTLTPVVYPTYDDQLNQMPTQFAGGTAPDVILWDNAAPVAQYATEDVILDLTDLLPRTDVDLSVYPEALVSGWTIDGGLYAVPSYLQNSAAAYNTDELTAAGITALPTSMAEYGAAAEAFTEATGKPGVVLLDNLFHLTQYMLAFGGGYDYGRTISSAENVEALDFLLALFADGAAATAQQVGATWDGEALANGAAAMSDAGPWYIGFMATTAPDVGYQLQPLPGVAAGDQVVATYGGGFSITAATAEPDVAMQVVELLTDAEAQDAILTTGLGFVPAMTQYADTYREQTPEYAAFTTEVLAAGRTLDYPLQTTEFGNALVTGFQRLVADSSTSSQELLDSLQETYGQ